MKNPRSGDQPYLSEETLAVNRYADCEWIHYSWALLATSMCFNACAVSSDE